ncbi:MAG: ABC transporter permease [Clostridiales bacterium]|nr:ABC transporter permease [Clostridiales bacterium]
MMGALQLGLMYALLAMGVYISFRILNTPDLTAEGSFTLGVAVSAMVTMQDQPILALLAAFAAGALAGVVTGLLQTKVGIHPILAGILTMSGLYTVNMMVMNGAPNVTLLGKQTLYRMMFKILPFTKDVTKAVIGGVMAVLVLVLLIWFFKTHIGLCIRATGNNEAMVRSSSINASGMKVFGLALSNACIGLCGGLVAQYQGYADISSGIGMMVVGLASVIIGEAIFGKRGVTIGLISAIVGSVIYRILIDIALSSDQFPVFYLKLISAVIVAVALALPTIKEKFRYYRIRREGRRNA